MALSKHQMEKIAHNRRRSREAPEKKGEKTWKVAVVEGAHGGWTEKKEPAPRRWCHGTAITRAMLIEQGLIPVEDLWAMFPTEHEYRKELYRLNASRNDWRALRPIQELYVPTPETVNRVDGEKEKRLSLERTQPTIFSWEKKTLAFQGHPREFRVTKGWTKQGHRAQKAREKGLANARKLGCTVQDWKGLTHNWGSPASWITEDMRKSFVISNHTGLSRPQYVLSVPGMGAAGQTRGVVVAGTGVPAGTK